MEPICTINLDSQPTLSPIQSKALKMKKANSFCQLFSQISNQKSDLFILRKMISPQKISYIDAGNSLALVEGKYLDKIAETSKQVCEKSEIYERMWREQMIKNAALQQEISRKDQMIKHYQSNEWKIKRIQERQKKIDNIHNKRPKEIQLLDTFLITNNPTKLNSFTNSDCQTEFQKSIWENCFIVDEETIMRDKKQKIEVELRMQSKIVTVLQQEIQKLQKKVQENSNDLQKVSSRNAFLELENLKLKTALKEVNEKEKKIEIWKENMSTFIHSLEKSISS